MTWLLAREGTHATRLVYSVHHLAERSVTGLHILRVILEKRVHVAVRVKVVVAGCEGNITVGPVRLPQTGQDGGERDSLYLAAIFSSRWCFTAASLHVPLTIALTQSLGVLVAGKPAAIMIALSS
jgi:hypothetical protein